MNLILIFIIILPEDGPKLLSESLSLLGDLGAILV